VIITNYGVPGTGKSNFSASLAMAIEEANPRATVLIINYDTNVPMQAIWNPNREIARSFSLGSVFEDDVITQKSLTKRIVTLENNKNVGLLGYCVGDTPLSYEDVEYSQVINLLKAAEQLVDYVIVDCEADLLNTAIAASVEMANCLNVFLSPDPNGIIYFKTSNLTYGNNSKFLVDNTNYIIGPYRSFHAIKEMKNLLNAKTFELPYSADIAVKNCEGSIFQVYKAAPRKYKNVVKKILLSTNEKSERTNPEDIK